MRMKYIFVIIILLFCMPLLYSEDETAPVKNKGAVEFSIGGGIKPCISYKIINYYYYYNYLSAAGRDTGINIGIVLPVSFVYYLNNFFGIGFIYKFSISGLFYITEYNYFDTGISFDNYFNLINKIGNNEKMKFLLLEYGVMTSLKNMKINCFTNYSTVNINLYLGPNILIGYEKRSKENMYLYTIGGFFETQFNLTRYNILRHEFNNSFELNEVAFYTGLEIRWRYCYFSGSKE